MPQIAEIARWNEDPEFSGLPHDRKQKVLENFFDRHLVDETFLNLPQEDQDRIKTNFYAEHIGHSEATPSKPEALQPPAPEATPGGVATGLFQGLAEGLTTELPSMAGQAMEYVGSYLPDELQVVENVGRDLKEWAEKKKESMFGSEKKRVGLERWVYEGSKMLAPSIVPAGMVGMGVRVLTGVGKLVKLGKAAQAAGDAVKAAELFDAANKAAKTANTIASVSTAGMFGTSQAQQTIDTAKKRAGLLTVQGDLAEAQRVMDVAGETALATGMIEATGEYFGTKYLGKLFRLDEAGVAKRGKKQLVTDFLKTLGVEVSTEIGQQYGEAGMEKVSGIRPEADPLEEALDVIGPTTFMTLITGGAAGTVNMMRQPSDSVDLMKEEDKEPDLTDEIRKAVEKHRKEEQKSKPSTAREAAEVFFGPEAVQNEDARRSLERRGLYVPEEGPVKSAEESAQVFEEETAAKQAENIRKEYAARPTSYEQPIGGPRLGERMPASEATPIEKIDQAANEAATSPLNDRLYPTDAQKEAGNYKKGHVSVHGLDITIENPKGSERSGIGKDGKPWSVVMEHPYGYFKRSQGKDGEQIDVIIGPDPESDKAFIVDQINPGTGKWDEHKTLIGFKSEKEARKGYLENYEPGWKGLGAITEMPMDKFKEWVKDGRKTKPVAYKEGENAAQIRSDEGSVLLGEKRKLEETKPGPVTLGAKETGALRPRTDEGGQDLQLAEGSKRGAGLRTGLTPKTTIFPSEEKDRGVHASEEAEGVKKTFAATPEMVDRIAKGKTVDDFEFPDDISPMGIGVLWDSLWRKHEEEKAQNKPKIDAINKQLEALKSKRDKAANEKKRKLRKKIDDLKAEADVIAAYAENAFMSAQEKISDKIMAAAEKEGLAETEDDRNNIYDLISSMSDGRYNEEGWSKPLIPQVIDYLREEKGVKAPTSPLRPEAKDEAGILPHAPFSEDWVSDRGAMPGEPALTYKDKGAIIERENDQGKILYEGVTEAGDSLGVFPDIEDARKAVEIAVDRDDKLVKHINKKEWWRTEENQAGKKERGQFLASSYKEAEFYGRPIDAPFKVNIQNPLIGDEKSIHETLEVEKPEEDISVPKRFALDKKLAKAAVEKGYDSIALMTSKDYQAYRSEGKIPRSIELNDLSDLEVTIYHYTTKVEAEKIKKEGLKSGSYVSTDEGTAWDLRKRAGKEADEMVSFQVNRKDLAPDDLAEMEGTKGSFIYQPGSAAVKVFPNPDKTVKADSIAKKSGEILTPEQAQKRLESWKAEAQRVAREEDHSKEVVLSLFDRTGVWSKPYAEAGYNVITYDAATGDDVFKDNPLLIVKELEERGWDIVGILSAPPCTSFSVSGARWWENRHDIENEDVTEELYGRKAAQMFPKPIDAAEALAAIQGVIVEIARERGHSVRFYSLENPIGRIAERIGLPEPTLTFNPNNYGDPYTKKTQLWGEFNPDLPFANVEPTEGSKIAKLRGDVAAQKLERSVTPEGFAYAFFMANHSERASGPQVASTSAGESRLPSHSTSAILPPRTQEPSRQTAEAKPPSGVEASLKTKRPIEKKAGYSDIAHPPKDNLAEGKTEVNKRIKEHLIQAEKAKPRLEKTLLEIAEPLDGKTDLRVKNEKRVIDKVERNQKDDPAYGPDDISDYLGSRIVVSDPMASHEEIAGKLEKSDYAIQKTHDMISTPNKWGYRAIHIDVTTPEGSKAEVQLHFPEGRAISGKSHRVYEKWRKFGDKELSELAPEKLKQYKADRSEIKTLWDEAYNKYQNRTKVDLSSKSLNDLVGDMFDIINEHIKKEKGIGFAGTQVLNDELFEKLKPYLKEIVKRAKAKALDAKAYLMGAVDSMKDSPAKSIYEKAAERYLREGEKQKEKKTDEIEKGDRVVITEGPHAGKHGEITEVVKFNMTPIFGAGKVSAVVTYTVKTDDGASVPASKITRESGRVTPEKSALSYEEFSKQYREAFKQASKYTPDQVGSRRFTDEMAKLADEYPEYLERLEEEEEKAQYAPFKEVLAKQRPGTGKFEIGDVYWWKHPDPKFKEYSKEVIVAGKEVDGKIPTYSFTKGGIPEAGIPAETAIPELTPKEELALLPKKETKALPSPSGVTVTFNDAKNGIELRFPDNARPDAETIQRMKAHGFRFSRAQKLWYAKDTIIRRKFVGTLMEAKTPVITSESVDSEVKKVIQEAKNEGHTEEEISEALREGQEHGEAQGAVVAAQIDKPQKVSKKIDKSKYPVFIDPSSKKEYRCVLFAVDIKRTGPNQLGGTGWEWFGFQKESKDIYYGLVHGFETEWGSFSLAELRENGVFVQTDPEQLNSIMPPIGWTRKEAKTAEKPLTKPSEEHIIEVQREEGGEEGALLDRQPAREDENDRTGIEGPSPEDLQRTEVGGETEGILERSRRGHDAELPRSNRGSLGQDRTETPERPREEDTGTSHVTQRKVERSSGDVAGVQRPDARDHRITPGSIERKGSWHETAARNLDIIQLVKKLESENRLATPEEQSLLALFTGWGASEIRNKLFPGYSGSGRLYVGWADSAWKPLVERVENLFTEDELRTAARSTQYAHYTSEKVVRSIWSGLQRMGFPGGRVFEPGMGTGNFAGIMPDGVYNKSSYTGIEFDNLTAAIAKQLYPRQNIVHGDYTRQKFPNNFFDLAIGNPPFSQTKILVDPDYKKYAFSLHDYFFAKTIDKVRPGGMLVFVTSHYTMDKVDDRARAYLAERADLIGAIRLPQTAFKESAGTEVVTDVLFLRKRDAGQELGGHPWTKIEEVDVENEEKKFVNEYFVAHPEMVLGSHSAKGSMYGKNEYTVLPKAGDIEEHFATAIKNLPENIYSIAKRPAQEQKEIVVERDWNPKNKKEGGIYLSDKGELMRVSYGAGKPLSADAKLTPKETEWLKDYIPLRDLLKQARYDQFTDGDWEKSLAELNKVYDKFVKKHGKIKTFIITERKEKDEDGSVQVVEYRRYKFERLALEDVEGPLVLALERVTEEGDIVKDHILLGRTIKRPERGEIKSMGDALAVSLDEKGRLDLAHIAELLKQPEEGIAEQLGNLVYENPTGTWELADEYLSGDVVTKLEEAEAAAKADPKYLRNVDALVNVQPKPLTARDVTVSLGSSWVNKDYIEQFSAEVLGTPLTVEHKEVANHWRVTIGASSGAWRTKRAGKQSKRGASDWSTHDRGANEILEAVLNQNKIVIRRTERIADGTRTYTDEPATTAVNEIAGKMRDRFRSWIWEDADRASDILTTYNRKYNNIAPRKFDGSHLTLPGVSTRYTLHPHQKRAIWRIIQTGNTYLAHAVGAGKTMEAIAAGMEMRRLGMIRKPMYAVPNHMLAQFSGEFMDLYPMANIMVANEENFHTTNRRKFMAQAAVNDPDAIIITHSSFGLLSMKPENVEETKRILLDDLRFALDDMEEEKESRYLIRRMEQRIEQAEQRFDSIAGKDKGDHVVDFEDMGVDFLFVDEAHNFRKLDFHTNQQIKGIDPVGSKMALDLYLKMAWLESQSPGRSHVFMSGTPVTNTMGELYTVMRYFDEGGMDRDGMKHFDSWSAMYGQTVADYEPNAAGRYELVTRFAKFMNIPELSKRVRQFMDVLTSDELAGYVTVPKVRGGGPQNIVAVPSPELENYQKNVLQKRLAKSRAWKPSKEQPGNPDPVINIITDGRLASIDMRFARPGMMDDKERKLNKMIDEIIRDYAALKDDVYFDNKGKPEARKGGAQIVFFNHGFGQAVAGRRGFDAKKWVNDRLKAAKIPTSEIAWIDDYDTAAKKASLFKEMRQGTKKILFGSAKKMGTGMNVQKRLKGLHYLDPPWYPADVEQPHGRIIRQGNQNDEIFIKWYATKGTYDSTMWQMVSRKARFITQFFKGDESIRSMDDISEVNQYEMARALSSGDERVIRLVGLEADVLKYSRLKEAHAQEQYKLRREKSALESDNKFRKGRIKDLKEADKKVGGYVYKFEADVGSVKGITKHGELGEAVIVAYNRAASRIKAGEEKEYGSINGISLAIRASKELLGNDLYVSNIVRVTPKIFIEINNGVFYPEGTDTVGLGRRVVNRLNDVSEQLRERENEYEENETKLKQIDKKLGAPFAHERELAEKIAEVAQLQTELTEEGERTPENTTDITEEIQENESEKSILDDERGAIPADFFPGTKQVAEAVSSVISPIRESIESGILQRSWDEFRFQAQDRFHYLNKTQMEVEEKRGEGLSEEQDAYLAETRYHGMAAAAIDDFEERHVTPLLELMNAADITVEQVDEYLHARHAKEANDRLRRINPDREDNEALSGMTDAEADRILHNIERSSKVRAFERIGQMVDVITKERRDLLVEAGLETADTIDRWEETYKYYVPLMREGKGGHLPRRGKGYDVRGGQKIRGGSTREVVNILANVIAQHEATIVRAEKAKVGRAFLEFAKNNPGPWKIDTPERTATLDAEGLVVYRANPMGFMLADNVLAVRVDDKDHHITFDQNNLDAMRIASAMKNLDAADMGSLVRAISKISRWLAIVNTSLNPEFIISNFARDIQTAAYNMSDSEADAIRMKAIKQVGSAFKGIRDYQANRRTTEWAGWFNRFRNAGAQTGWVETYRSIEDREKELIRKIEAMKPGKVRTIKRGVQAAFDYIGDVNTAVENAIRLSVFKNLIEAGVPEAKAAKIAKELTVNFNRKGNMGPVLNALYLFYNASIQGSARLIMAGAKSPKVRKLMVATVMFAACLDIFNRMIGAGDDDEEENRYDRIAPWVKERNLIIMLPKSHGYIQIPLPWGYNVFHVIGQAAGEVLTKKNNKVIDSVTRVGGAIISAFNPMGGEASILQVISPTLTDPFVQWAENKDWSGRKLRPSSNIYAEKPMSQTYWSSVREPSKWFAGELNRLTGGDEIRPGKIDISPEAIDLAIDTFTGGAGKFMSNLISTPIKAVKGDDIETYEIPFLRRVYGKPGKQQLTQEYYENADTVRLVDRQIAHYKSDPAKLKEIVKEYRPEVRLISRMKATREAMKELRVQAKSIEKIKNPEVKERRKKVVEERMEKVMGNFNKNFNLMKGMKK